MIKTQLFLSIGLTFTFTGCSFTTNDYAQRQAEAVATLPTYEKAFADTDCFNNQFKFKNGMTFEKNDALISLKCLEIERIRNELREQAKGIIEHDELAANYAYNDNRAIFTYLANGEISLTKARDLYMYTAKKSWLSAQAKMERSNRLLMQGIENQRRAWDQENRNRDQFLQSMVRSLEQRPPIVTRCNTDAFGSVTCTTM